MASSSTNKAKTNQDPGPLNCPRCDSSNTKFCYYNNYSLSQPRHFCKACKRYWTRGGTLRNVPVGGGCRKNNHRHKQKRHPPTSNQNPPLFYGLPSNSSTDLQLDFPLSDFRVSSGLDLQSQINDLGLGLMSGFKPIQDAISNSTSWPFSSSANNSIFFGSSSFSASSTMASLLAFQKNITNTIPSLMGYEDPQMAGDGIGKHVKAEEEKNRLAWNPNPMDDQMNSSDPSSLLWNSTSIGAWIDPASTMGSSVSI